MNDGYLQYDAVTLAQDEAFLRWVRGESPALAGLWEAWLAAHPEMAEPVAEARLLARSLVFREERPAPEQIERLWTRIHEATPAVAARRPLRLTRWVGYAAAAAIALLLAFFFLWRGPKDEVQLLANRGETQDYALPDGSKASLNAGSSLSYEASTFSDKRHLKLSGEAFFEVQKGSPFQVETEMGSVEVLGTSFNVNTHDGQFNVMCYSGRVQVHAGLARQILEPGQSAKLLDGMLAVSRFEPSSAAGWRQGHFDYQNAQLGLVFAEMERQFDISIEAPDSILQRRYTGFFERNSLDSALYMVCWPMQLTSEKDGKTIRITPADQAGE